MKIKVLKFTVFLISFTVLNLMLVSPAWGSINISGLTHFKYNITNNHDYLEANFFFNNKINDNANAYASLQFITSFSSPEALVFNYGTIYFTYKMKQDLGNFTVGFFENNLHNLFFLTSTVDKLRSSGGIKFERRIVPNLSFKIGYFPNEHYNAISQTQTAMTGIAYTDSYFGADLNLVKTSNDDLLSGAVNLFYKPNAGFKAYAHYCQDYNQEIDQILGIAMVISPTSNPLALYCEYNFASGIPGSDSLGYGITYSIDKNITLCYYRYLTTNEFRVSISW